jgi:hypothetical protein
MERKKTGKAAVKTGGVAVLERPQAAAQDMPQNMTEQVRRLAYSLYEKRGYAHGNDWHDWFEAEKTIKYSGTKPGVF